MVLPLLSFFEWILTDPRSVFSGAGLPVGLDRPGGSAEVKRDIILKSHGGWVEDKPIR